MTKASVSLQDLRRRIYVKAKSETSWRFWGLYVHVCKMETLQEAYAMAKNTAVQDSGSRVGSLWICGGSGRVEVHFEVRAPSGCCPNHANSKAACCGTS
jgi:hypothetical protein